MSRHPPSIAVQALSPEGKTRAKQVWDYQRGLSRAIGAIGRKTRILSIGAYVVAALEAVAILKMTPLIRVVPVFVPVLSDGNLTEFMQNPPSMTASGLKNDKTAIQALLWQYVRYREQYNWGDAQLEWDVVSAMSAVDVREQFQKWFDYKDPQSPQKLYGYTSAIKLSWVESNLKGDEYTVTFWRQLYTDGSAASKPDLWTCHLRWTTDYTMPIAARLQFDSPGIVVTYYPGCFPKGEAPGGLTMGTHP